MAKRQYSRSFIWRLIDILLVYWAYQAFTQGDYFRAVLYGLVGGGSLILDFYRERKYGQIIQDNAAKSVPYLSQGPSMQELQSKPYIGQYVDPGWKERFQREGILQERGVEYLLTINPTEANLSFIDQIDNEFVFQSLFLKSPNQNIRSAALKNIEDQEFLKFVAINHPENNHNILFAKIEDINYKIDILQIASYPNKAAIINTLVKRKQIFHVASINLKGVIGLPSPVQTSLLRSIEDQQDSYQLIDLATKQYEQKQDWKAVAYVTTLARNLPDPLRIEFVQSILNLPSFQQQSGYFAMINGLIRDIDTDLISIHIYPELHRLFQKNNQSFRLLQYVYEQIPGKFSIHDKKRMVSLMMDEKKQREFIQELISSIPYSDQPEMYHDIIELNKFTLNHELVDNITDKEYLRGILFDQSGKYSKSRPMIARKLDLSEQGIEELLSSIDHYDPSRRAQDLMKVLLEKVGDPNLKISYLTDSSISGEIRKILVKDFRNEPILLDVLFNELKRYDEQTIDNSKVLEMDGKNIRETPLRDKMEKRKKRKKQMPFVIQSVKPSNTELIEEIIKDITDLDLLLQIAANLQLKRSRDVFEKIIVQNVHEAIDDKDPYEIEKLIKDPKYQPLFFAFRAYVIRTIKENIDESDQSRYHELTQKQSKANLITKRIFSEDIYQFLSVNTKSWEDLRFILPCVQVSSFYRRYYFHDEENPILDITKKVLLIRNMEESEFSEFLEEIIFSDDNYILRNEAVKQIQNRSILAKVLLLDDEIAVRQSANHFISRYNSGGLFDIKLIEDGEIDIRMTALSKLQEMSDPKTLEHIYPQIKDEKIRGRLENYLANQVKS